MQTSNLYKAINELVNRNRYLTYTVLFATVVLISKLIVAGANDTPDSIGYLNTVELLRGNLDPSLLPELLQRGYLLRSLGSLIAFPLSYIFGVWNAFVVENSILYLLSVVFMYAAVEKLYSSKIAFYAAVLYASSPVLTTFGLAILQDMGIWFFYIGSVYLTLRFFGVGGTNENETRPGNVYLFAFGVFVGLGMLMKESAIAGLFFFILVLLFSRHHSKHSVPKKIMILAIVFVATALPLAVNESITYTYFNNSHFNSWDSDSGPKIIHTLGQTVYNLVKSFVMAFNVLIPLFLIGYYKEWKQHEHGNFAILTMLLLSSLPIVVGWPWNATRFAFLTFPAIIPLAAYGISELPQLMPRQLQNNTYLIMDLDKIVLILCVLANLVVTFYIGITDGGIFEQLEWTLIQ